MHSSSSSPLKGALTMSPRIRKRPSAHLEVSTIGSCSSVVSLDEMAELEDSIAGLHRKPSSDEFSRIVNEISTHRRMNADVRNRRSHQSFASSDDGRSGHSRISSFDGDVSTLSAVNIPPCCCGQPECEVSRRVLQQIHDMESDLQLSAEIGQALLQRQDAIVHRSQQEAEEHAHQRDQLLARLTQTIKETQVLQRQLSQATFNLEAADQSHHALLSELDEVRHQLKQTKMHRIKASSLEAKLERVQTELEDTRVELANERRRFASAEAKQKQVVARRCEELRARWDGERSRMAQAQQAASQAKANIWDAVRARLAAKQGASESAAGASEEDEADPDPFSDDALREIMNEHEALRHENEHLQTLLRSMNDEMAELREMSEGPGPLVGVSLEADIDSSPMPWHASEPRERERRVVSDSSRSEAPSEDMTRRSDGLSEGTAITTPSTSSRAHMDDDVLSYDTGSIVAYGSERDFDTPMEQRTALLSTFLEAASSTYSKLQKADIDSLTARLQRQKLAGDVGHLSRTTVQANVRDLEGWREHFRKALDKEARRGVPTDSSLVSRRDFFTLLKLQRDILLEIARLRRCINEVHLNPGAAAKLLHEHLGANTLPANRSWISRMLTGVLSTESSSSASSTAASSAAPAAAMSTPSSATPDTSKAPVTSTTVQDSAFVRFVGNEAAPMAVPRSGSSRPSAAPPTRMMPRSRASALSSSVAVHAHGAYANTKSGVLKTKASQPALIELAATSSGAPNPSPNMVMPWKEPTLRTRARGLSDSSIHSTFLDHGAANDSVVDRVITSNTLTLASE